jgi:hypothetical protein
MFVEDTDSGPYETREYKSDRQGEPESAHSVRAHWHLNLAAQMATTKKASGTNRSGFIPSSRLDTSHRAAVD